MKVLADDVNVHQHKSLAEYGEDITGYDTRTMLKGMTISILECDSDEEPVEVLELEHNALVSCPSFGQGYTSDGCLIIQEEGQEEVWEINNEPEDLTNDPTAGHVTFRVF